MAQSKSKTESFGAAFYGNGKRASVVDITDKLMGGKAGAKKPFRMAAKDGVGEIFIYDDIGSGFFSDGVTPKSFADDLKALGAVRTLNIFINSPGGSVFDGVSIYNQLKRHSARKNVFIDGIAASIASVIAMAGDEISIAANGFMMIHEPWSCACGNASDLRRTADQLDKINDSIIDTYAARTPTPENVIADMMAAETWMNAEEAVEHGFADQITEEVQIAAHFDLSQFQNVPEDVAAKLDLAKNPPKVEFAHGGLVAKGAANFKEQQARLKDVVCGGNLPSKDDTVMVVAIKHPEEGEKIITVEEECSDDQPRTPSLAITKMRQRIQKRGIAPKGDDNDQTAA
jgi:ATP-dependent Clp protease protease subunit